MIFSRLIMADNSDTESQSTQAVAEVPALVKYLRKIVPLLLEDGEASPALDNALADKSHVECMKKFLSDTQTSSILVERNVNKEGKLISRFLINTFGIIYISRGFLFVNLVVF